MKLKMITATIISKPAQNVKNKIRKGGSDGYFFKN